MTFSGLKLCHIYVLFILMTTSVLCLCTCYHPSALTAQTLPRRVEEVKRSRSRVRRQRNRLPAKQNQKDNKNKPTTDSSAFTVNTFPVCPHQIGLFVAAGDSGKWVAILNKSAVQDKCRVSSRCPSKPTSPPFCSTTPTSGSLHKVSNMQTFFKHVAPSGRRRRSKSCSNDLKAFF